MIRGNQIHFGYGDIEVGGNGIDKIIFKDIKPPQEIGESLYGKVYGYVGNEVVLTLTLSDLYEFKELLENVNETNPIVHINNFVLNFEKFNQKSINVVQKAVNIIIRNNLKLCAC